MDAPVATKETVASQDGSLIDLGLRFDNSFARLPSAFYTRLPPAPLPEPYLVGFSKAAGELIGVGEEEVPELD